MNQEHGENRPRLASRSIDTGVVPREDGEAAWEALLTPVTSPDRLERQPFGGSIHAWHASEAMLCDVRADQQVTRRNALQLSLGPPPLYTLLLVCRGRMRYQDGRYDKGLLPGDLLVEDMAAPRTLVAERHQTLQLILPYSVAGVVLPTGLHGEVLPRRHTATRLLARHLLELRSIIHRIDPRAFRRHLEVATHLLLAALPQGKRQASEMSHLQRVVRAEIERYIDIHLTSPELSAAQLSKTFRISRSQLYRLFRASSGPSAYIRLRRLNIAARQIQANRDSPDKWEGIAQSLGFHSVADLDAKLRERFESSVAELASSPDDLLESHRADSVGALFARLPGTRHAP